MRDQAAENAGSPVSAQAGRRGRPGACEKADIPSGRSRLRPVSGSGLLLRPVPVRDVEGAWDRTDHATDFSPGRHRELAEALQHRPPPFIARLRAARPRGCAAAGCANPTCSGAHPSRRAQAHNATTFNPDHSMGSATSTQGVVQNSAPQFETQIEAFSSEANATQAA